MFPVFVVDMVVSMILVVVVGVVVVSKTIVQVFSNFKFCAALKFCISKHLIRYTNTPGYLHIPPVKFAGLVSSIELNALKLD